MIIDNGKSVLDLNWSFKMEWISISQIKKLILASIITPLILLFQPVEHLINPLIWIIIADILFGMYVARTIDKVDLTSRRFLRKFYIIGLFLAILFLSLKCDPFFTEFGLEKHKVAKWICSLYAVYEFISIVEKTGKMGLPIAKQISEWIKAKTDIKTDEESK